LFIMFSRIRHFLCNNLVFLAENVIFLIELNCPEPK
jgi:hypothetical protein